MGQRGVREEFLQTYSSSPHSSLGREKHTIARLFEAMSWVVVGGVDVHVMAQLLQAQSCIYYKTFCAPCMSDERYEHFEIQVAGKTDLFQGLGE